MSETKEKIIVGMSGGVDSSVTALLLKNQGQDVSGVFMRNWEEDSQDGPCTAEIDAHDALAVCEQIGIDFDAVCFSNIYWERVFQHFLSEYKQGRTPNPDILCNKEVKFRAFLDYAMELGADRIATGHYARIRYEDGYYRLLKGVDPEKDQSYFLYLLDQSQLAKARFPLGDLTKTQVRKIALETGFANHAKKDSTGICFIGERRFKQFLSQYVPARPGEIRTLKNKVIGVHDGLMFHTIGQRKGLGIGGTPSGSGEPWYVVKKDLASNILYVAQGHDHPWLYSSSLEADQVHWIGILPTDSFRCMAKTRYRQTDQACEIIPLGNNRLRVVFELPQWAVTAGQSVVFYAGEVCLGGGIIDRVETRLEQENVIHHNYSCI